MAAGHLQAVLRHIRKLAGTPATAEVTDGQLLERFVRQHDKAAFELLVRRHERMVWGVCQRLLANCHDAEDAFQAAFVVLLRKAGTVRKCDSIGSWLYQVAYRIALRVRANRARMAAREHQAIDPSAIDTHDFTARVDWQDIRPMLDQELNRLPEKYRAPVVLCYLEGKSYEEAAKHLGCPKGTVATRLTRARELLYKRLARRGLGLTIGLLTSGLVDEAASASVPIALAASAVRHATVLAVNGAVLGSGVSAKVATLAEGALHGMFLTQVKFAMVVLLAASLVTAGAGVVVRQSLLAKIGQEKPTAEAKLVAQVAAEQRPEGDIQPRTDRYGDPLPPGALQRLGTLRHRYIVGGQRHWIQRLILPDGKTALMTAPDEVRWLDRSTGRTTASWPLPKGYMVCAVSRDGRLALLGRSETDRRIKQLHLFDLTARKELRTFEGQDDFGETIYVVFSPDGQLVATNSGTDGAGTIRLIRVWDLTSGRELCQEGYTVSMEGPLGREIIGFSNGGATLVILDRRDNRVSLRERTTGREQSSFATLPAGESRSAVLSPDGSTLFMGNAGPAVRIWDITSGKELTSLGGHTLQAHSVSISRDGKTVVTYGGAPYLLVWDWPAAKLRRKIELGTTKSGQIVAVTPDGKQAEVVISGENAIRSFDLDSGRELPSTAEAHRAGIYAVEIAPDGKLISTGYDNTIRVWDLSSGRQLREIRTDHPVGGQIMALSLDGKLIATGEHVNSGVIALHDRDTGRLVKTIDPGGTSISWVAFTLEEGLLAVHSITEAKELFLAFFDIEQGREVRRLSVQALRYVLSPDGRLLAGYRPYRSGQDQDQLSLVDVATGREQQALRQKDVWAVAFSPDGRTLACGDSNGVTLWEITSGKQRCRIDAPAAGRPYRFCFDVLCFSSDGRWLARKADRAIQVCDVIRGQVVHTFTQHDDSVMGLAFAADNRTLASGSWDSTVLLWDLMGVAAQLPQPQEPSSAAVLAAWNNLASADAQIAFGARRLLVESPKQSLPFLHDRLRPASAPDANQIDRWLAELDSRRFADRERARRELERQAGRAEPALRRLLANSPTAEARQRAEGLLARLQGPITDPEMLRSLRAVEVLEYMATRDAQQLLQELARGAPESRLTREAKRSLGRLAKRAVVTP